MNKRLLLSHCAPSALALLANGILLGDAGAASPRQTLTLDAAIDLSLRSHPSEAQARAAVDVASARIEENRAPYLPQVVGTAQYQRMTADPTHRPNTPQLGSQSWTQSYDYFTFGGTASQLIYDFGQTSGRWSSAEASEAAAAHSEHAVQVQIITNVRKAHFQARALRDLIGVAADAVTNQEIDLKQIVGSGGRRLAKLTCSRRSKSCK
jgi:outer membrane protein